MPENTEEIKAVEEEKVTGETVSLSEQTAQQEAPDNRDEALFKRIATAKKKKKRKTVLIVIFVVLAVLAALFITVMALRTKVRNNYTFKLKKVTSSQAIKGSIHTTVAGSGTLEDDDIETLSVPEGVEIDEVVVKANQVVSQGDVVATVNMTSVVNAMSSVQKELTAYDKKLAAAEGDKASESVKAGVTGRVKVIYTKAGEKVVDRMAQSGALMVLSTDGYMAVDITATDLAENTGVKVRLSNGKVISGKVKSAVNGNVTVVVTDNGTKYGDAVTVLSNDGQEKGSGELYIHSPLKITGFAGTVSKVNVSLNAKVKASTVVLKLKNTSYSANYDSILRDRNEKEEELMELLRIYKDGAVRAPLSGSVISVDYDEDEKTADTSSTAAAMAAMTGNVDSTAAEGSDGETDIVTISPDKTMSVKLSVDEAKILSIEEGQSVEMTISSIGDDTYEGKVTDVDTEAESSSGVTKYTVTVTLDKSEGMLAGMTAKAVIRIQGVDDAIVIPVEALHQTSTSAFVFTSYDEETEQFGGQKEVTFGISNDDNVEITSGLNEGETVYYEAANNIFGFGGMGGMGSMGGMSGNYGGYGSGGYGSGNSSGGRPDFGGEGRNGKTGNAGGFGGGRRG